MKDLQSDLSHDPTVHFRTAAEHYCRLLENEIRPLDRDLVQRLLEVLLSLYARGLKLPDADSRSHKALLNHGARQKFFRTVAERLGGDHHYQMIFEPFDFSDSEAVTGGLADDLSDIYFDVKEGLLQLAQQEETPSHVVWQWKFGLETHWGRHAVNAIAALHSLLFGEHAIKAR